ncbi:NAD(P)/FAD-dependent oxidoreductase [Primorskyibacter sp. S87]|uniref:FAD/NAD(P)-dependent oxidoreductase n=1 Tax=Primorskyibacter sp. S87 TaxID=3415126 RepID=UPI003C7A8405
MTDPELPPDLIIIGAGPAGMAAAATTARAGARVLLLDDQPAPGGQIYRDVDRNRDRFDWLGQDYAQGAALVDALDHPNITRIFGATVWRIDAGPKVAWSRDGQSHTSKAPFLLLATGAQERPVPFPGWTLPGVMPAGAAQILMKNAAMLPRDAVLAGSGPLLYLMAAQMIDAGTPPLALVETGSRTALLAGLRHLPRATLGIPVLRKGMALLYKIRAHGIPRFTGASGFRADAETGGSLRFSFRSRGEQQNLTCRLLLTHQGVIPSTSITRAAGITHDWSPLQQCFHPVTDQWGRSSVDGIYVAGDGSGIAGADAAKFAGRLAARDILFRLGRISADARNQTSAADLGGLLCARSVRPLLDTLYAPPKEFLTPPDETIVCRCEEITAGELRQAIGEGATGHRLLKTATRAGMGPCQGRMCDATVRGILSEQRGIPPAIPPRARNPVKPVTLGELASLAADETQSS